nr:hypothetical protein [Tanacetum cinerariifolium]
ADEPASPLRDVNQGEPCPTNSVFIADQDRATIDKSSTLPHDLAPRVTSPAAIEGSMQQTINELMALCTSLQRQYSELVVKFEAHELEITRLKARVKLLEDREGVAVKGSGDDAPIKGRNLDEGEAAVERASDDTEEMTTVLMSIDAATVLASGAAEVPTGIADEPASPLRDVNQGEPCPTNSVFIADQDRATIDKSSTLPHDLAPRVTSPAAIEGSMQQTINELMALCTSLQRQYSELVVKFEAHELEITRLKARVKLLEDREGVAVKGSGDDAPIKGRNLDEGEAAVERASDDTEEMTTVLMSIDAATVLASGAAEVPTGS